MNTSAVFHNILVHALVNIGDVLLSTSAVALLRQICPQAKITMMVRPDAAALVLNNPVIDEVIVYDYKAKQKSIKSMLRIVKMLKQKNFDLVISFDRKLRPAILTYLAGIPTRVVPEKILDDKPTRLIKLYTNIVKMNYNLWNASQAENFQSVIRGFFPQAKLLPVMRPVMAAVKSENEKTAQSLLNRLEIENGTKKIALCVKGTFSLKNWPQDRFAQVIDKLAKKYPVAVFIVGAPGDREYAEEVIKLANTAILNFCGETTLVDLAALIKKADLFITIDTGAVHIGATTGVPMIDIFGCGTPKRWPPLTDKGIAISSYEVCAPCKVPADGCLNDKKCLMNISVDEVYTAAEKLLVGDN